MATLAQINETLRDQTSSIEDGTRTTAGLRDRFGEFLDRQTGSGDKREQEIEERQKERRQRVVASRPTSFTQGITQGLGFGNGLGFGAIAQKILAGMGLAAGAVGLGAGRLLRFGPAIAVLSDWGNEAIQSMVDYIDDNVLDEDRKLNEDQKKDLSDGIQTALGARLLGIKNPLAIAVAGVVGAYGDSAIEKFNDFMGKENGTYKVPFTDLEIDTETDEFKKGMSIALAAAAIPLLKFAGAVLGGAIALLPATRFSKLMLGTVTTLFGLKTTGDLLKANVQKRYDAKRMMKINNPIGNPAKVLGGSAASSLVGGGRGTSPGRPFNIKPAFPKNPSYVGRGPDGKFMSFNNPLGEGGKVPKSATGLSSFLNSAKKFNSAMLSTLKLTTKAIPFIGVAAEAGLAQLNDNLGPEMSPLDKAAAGVMTSPIALIDSLQNLTAFANNMVNTGVNYGLDAAGIDYQFGMMKYSDMSGEIQRAISRGYAQQLQNPPVVGQAIPNVGLSAEGFTTAAGFPDNPPVSVRGGDTNIRNDTIIQGVGQVISPADHFLIKVD